MPHSLTAAQLAAVTSDAQDICVSAGAGSGKTRVLVARYVRLIAESIKGEASPEPAEGDEILVITFTDLATREMQSRIITELTAAGMHTERSRIEAGWISTIHALCARILRENPFAAGIHPDFRMLESSERDALLRSCFDDAAHKAAAARDDNYEGVIRSLLLLKRSGGIRRDVVETLADECGRWIGRMRSSGVALEDLTPRSVQADPERDDEGPVACERFVGFCSSVWARYRQEKQRLGVLDAEDLLADCVRLLQGNADVLNRYRRKFRHILVDETQDTNRLQMRLVELLHSAPESANTSNYSRIDETDVTPNSLFVVGDRHQSIYGFRDAEPGIFAAIEQRVANQRAGTHVALSENFRSRPELLGLVEQIFTSSHQAQTEKFMPMAPAAAFHAKSEPSVELLVSRHMARRDYVLCEAEAIARRLKRIVCDKPIRISSVEDERAGEPVSYGDMAILLRSLTDLQSYEDALTRLDIPVSAPPGGSMRRAGREITDLLSALTLIESPLNDHALLTALRSPLVGASIDTLYRLNMLARVPGEKRTRNALFTAIRALLQSGAVPDEEKSKIRSFIDNIHSRRQEHDRVPPVQLIERFIVESNYDFRLVCRPDGRRKLANVRRIVQLAVSCDSLEEFLSRAKRFEQFGDRDSGQAEEDAGAVRILTMHSAKGLEFPLVVISDLSRSLLAPETGIFATDPRHNAIGTRITGAPDAAFRTIVDNRRNAERAEYLRLLYVAMTRAREHLILCGNLGRNRGYNWADIVFAALGVEEAPAAPEIRMVRGEIAALVSPIEAGMRSERSGAATDYETGEQLAAALLLGGQPAE